MTGKRLFLHSVFVVLLPLIVAWFGLSLLGAGVLVLAGLAWRWAISLSAIAAPASVPDLELETISASHFVEKVRWSMDRLGLDYREKPVAGTLGAFFLGRTVPQLKIRTGAVRSVIGNSPEILRYLWGAYAAPLGDRAAFLEPTPERLETEKRLGVYGTDLQIWIYRHILQDRELTLQAWGANSPEIPLWQRYALIALFPVLRMLMIRAFRITDSRHARSVARIEELLGQMEARLGDGRKTLSGNDSVDFVDITFASLSALWVQPAEFGAGKADAVRVTPEQLPADMLADMQRWSKTYPTCRAFIERLYREERTAR